MDKAPRRWERQIGSHVLPRSQTNQLTRRLVSVRRTLQQIKRSMGIAVLRRRSIPTRCGWLASVMTPPNLQPSLAGITPWLTKALWRQSRVSHPWRYAHHQLSMAYFPPAQPLQWWGLSFPTVFSWSLGEKTKKSNIWINNQLVPPCWRWVI